jgi:DNA-binding response OmpR family regulator
MRILVVEDEKRIADFLSRGLQGAGYAVDAAPNGATAVDLIHTTDYDLVILDLMLPRLDGFRVLRTLRAEGLMMPVLILTARGEEADKVRGLKLGADDYVTKPFGVLELLARVEAQLRRNSSPAVEHVGGIEIDRSTRRVTRDGKGIELAPREFDLLVALADRRGAIASRLDLMREVWGWSDSVITRTIDTHVAELRRKLEIDPARPRLILTVRKAGYRLAREE